MQTHRPESRRLLRREAPWKRSVGSIEGVREVTSADLRIGTWITGRSIAEETRTPTANILMNMRDHQRNRLGHILRVDEDRLVREVLPKCVKPEKELLFGDIPNLNVKKAIENARDRENSKKLRLARGYLLTLLQLPLIEVGDAVRAYCYSIASYP